MAVNRPVVARKPSTINNPSKLPTSDILTLSSFDLISRINNKPMVARRPAILAAVKGEQGNNTVNQAA